MNLSALADFHSLVDHGGIGRTSRATGQPKTTLSRRLRELENALDVRLVERGPRAFRLTEEGAALRLTTQSLLAQVEEAAQAVSGGLKHPRGRLRISTPVLFADVFVGRIAAAFAVRYPDVELEVVADDKTIDPIADGFDIVVRVNPSPQADLVGRCFLRDETLVVAPPSLGRPARGRSAKTDRSTPAVVVSAMPEVASWRVMENGRSFTFHPKVVLRLSSLLVVREAVRFGAGAAMLPRSIVADDLEAGRLISWGTASNRIVALWVLHTSRRLISPKVTAFIELLCDAFPSKSCGSPSIAAGRSVAESRS